MYVLDVQKNVGFRSALDLGNVNNINMNKTDGPCCDFFYTIVYLVLLSVIKAKSLWSCSWRKRNKN